MIVTRLIGGLGNQMFQYAVGRCLAEKHDTELRLDITGFENYTLHKYKMNVFNIQERFSSDGDVANVLFGKNGFLRKMIFRKFKRTIKPNASFVREKQHYHFDPKILEKPDNTYLAGYWQSEKYFKDIKDIIRREFSIKLRPDEKNKETAKQILAQNAVSLHIRRGDYVTDEKTNATLGVCDLAYYSRCIKHIAKSVENPHFFIFSDDPAWVRKNLKTSYPQRIVDHNSPERGYEDLRLMSKCKHHILANSSFSWWGAWLNPNEDKIVLAPKDWLKEYCNTDDLIPEGWVRI